MRTRVRSILIATAALLALGVAPAALAKATRTKFPYTYVNPDGSKTIIPSQPKRVVLTNQPEQEMDMLVSLGVYPLGSASSSGLTGDSAQGCPAWLSASELQGGHEPRESGRP
jgi:ABC-type Fe3+-hydroxamate transport system substrate-binding protein